MNQIQTLGKRVHKKLQTHEIIRINGLINYSEIITNNGKKIVIALTLKRYEQHLSYPFFRGSKSCIINLKYMKTVFPCGSKIILKDGYELDIPRRRRSKLIEIVNNNNSKK